MQDDAPSLSSMFRMPTFSSPEMEEAFGEWDDKTKLLLRKCFLGVAILTVATVGALDAITAGDATSTMLALRAASCLILSFILYQYTRERHNADARDRLVFCFGMTASASMIISTLIAPSPGADFYPFLLSATMVYAGTLVMPRFKTIALFCLLTNLLYWPTVPFADISFPAICANAFIMTVTTLAVTGGAFNRERLEREQAIFQAELAETRRAAIQSRDEALEANRAKSHLLANVSHELRTPMNAILGFSDVMKRQMFGPLEHAHYLEYAQDIHNAGSLLQSSINDLLDVSRLEVGKMSWTDQWVTLTEMMGMAIKTCQRDADAAHIHLQNDSSDTAAFVFCDPDRMMQILVNLLTNAIKFSDANATVTLACRHAPEQTLISVTDTGCGIAAENIKRIREPFGQVDINTMITQKGGLGLGLSIVQGLLQNFDSELLIDSTVGVGTTVSFAIPDERIVHHATGRSQLRRAAGF